MYRVEAQQMAQKSPKLSTMLKVVPIFDGSTMVDPVAHGIQRLLGWAQ